MPDNRTAARRAAKQAIADLITGALDAGLPVNFEADQYGVTEKAVLAEMVRQADLFYKASEREH